MLENDYKPLYKHAESSISKAHQNSTLSPKNARNVQNSKSYKAATCCNKKSKSNFA